MVERTGVDLREVDLVVLSGGALRHGRAGVAERVLADSIGPDVPGGWQLPEHPRVVVDADYVLAAVGPARGRAPGGCGTARPHPRESCRTRDRPP